MTNNNDFGSQVKQLSAREASQPNEPALGLPNPFNEIEAPSVNAVGEQEALIHFTISHAPHIPLE